jgi:signal transduction histidine kinase
LRQIGTALNAPASPLSTARIAPPVPDTVADASAVAPQAAAAAPAVLRHWSIAARLAWAVTGVVTAVWLASFAALFVAAQHDRAIAADHALTEAARMLLAFADHELAEIRAEGGPEGVSANPHDEEVLAMYYQVWSSDGKLLYRSSNAPTTPIVAADAPPGLGKVVLDGQHLRSYNGWDDSRAMQIQAIAPLPPVGPLDTAGAIGIAVTSVLALALLAWALRRVLRNTMDGIGQSTSLIAARAADDLQPIPDDALPDELRPLVRETNALLARVRAARASERRFVADAAHELRTPLAVLRAQTQVAQRAAGPDARDAQPAFAALLAGVDRATSLVEQLLTLSRADGRATFAPTQLRLDRVVHQQIESLRPWAEARGVALVADLAPLAVSGDPALLGALARNLIDNALRYAPQGSGRVRVHVAQAAGAGHAPPSWSGAAPPVELSVEDNGPGIAPPLRTRVFERFFRAPANGESGSGLGLAIVQTVAASHGALVALEDATVAPGLRVVVRFPSAA